MELTYGTVIKRALIAGLIAGALAAIYLLVVAEPTIDEAIRLEEAASAPDNNADDPLVTRYEQIGGGMLASVIYGGLVGVIFGTVYSSVRHRLTVASEFSRVVLLAAVAFATTTLLPALKYPANPPAVGDPDTIDQRTLQYAALIVFSIVAAALLARLSGQLRERFDDSTRLVMVTGAVIVVYGAALVLFPASPDSIQSSIPARLIWEFRLQSLGVLALLWTVIGLGLGWSLNRMTADARPPSRGTATVPA
ncbi:MAG: CbtA family protein [Acidimicrobiia bacterium]